MRSVKIMYLFLCRNSEIWVPSSILNEIVVYLNSHKIKFYKIINLFVGTQHALDEPRYLHHLRKTQGSPPPHTATKIPFVYSQKRNFCGLSPNFHIQVSLGDLYIPRIGPHIFLQQNRQTDSGNL